jgi:hypothetical protein
MSYNNENEPLNKNGFQKSFFEPFPIEEIFLLWESSKTLLELARKLGFNEVKGLSRIDYNYIQTLKDSKTWHKNVVSVNRKKERERYKAISQLSADELTTAISYEGIETVSHLALHYLVSPKHGRKAIRERVLELKLRVTSSLYKGIYGVSETPRHWPTKFYKKE